MLWWSAVALPRTAGQKHPDAEDELAIACMQLCSMDLMAEHWAGQTTDAGDSHGILV